MTLHTLTIHQAASLLRTGEISATALTQSLLERIYALDNTVKAYLALTPELALEAAAQADTTLAAARREGTLDSLSPLP